MGDADELADSGLARPAALGLHEVLVVQTAQVAIDGGLADDELLGHLRDAWPAAARPVDVADE